MNKLTLLYLSFGISLLSIVLMSSSNGVADVQDADRTGSPLSLPTCGSCHSGGNFGTTFSIQILDQTSGTAVNKYVPSTTYDIEYTVATSTGSPQAFGFQSVALMGVNNVQAGSYSVPSANTEIHTISNGRTYVEHATESASNLFTVKWTAPTAGNGPVTFYGIGNAVNDNNNFNGDQASMPVSVTLQENIPCTPPAALNSVVTNDDVVLSWSAVPEATGYEIVGGTIAAPTAVTLNVGPVTSLPVNNLTTNVTYVWKIKSICGPVSSDFSVTNQFFIAPPVCDPPSSLSSTVTGNNVVLNWTPVSGAIGYQIQGGPASSPTAVSLDVAGGAASSLPVSNLASGVYAWRVRAVCSLSPFLASAYTAFDQFTIPIIPQKTSVGRDGDAAMNSEFNTYVFPNPAKDLVTISLKESGNGPVNIEIYDLAGKLVMESRTIDADQVTLSVGSISNGVYQIVASNVSATQTTKLVISK